MFSALGYKTKGDNLYFLFLIIFSFFSFLFVLACGSCLRCFKDNRDNRDNFFLPLFFFSFFFTLFVLPLFVRSFFLFIYLFPSFFFLPSFLFSPSFIFCHFSFLFSFPLFCILPKANQLEDGGGYGGEHTGGKGESKIDTVAIIALKATRVEACEEERQEEEGDADRIERGAEFAAAVIGKEAHERYHDDADGGM